MCANKGLPRTPIESDPLEYTSPTPGCSQDADGEGGSERSTITSRNRRDVKHVRWGDDGVKI